MNKPRTNRMNRCYTDQNGNKLYVLCFKDALTYLELADPPVSGYGGFDWTRTKAAQQIWANRRSITRTEYPNGN